MNVIWPQKMMTVPAWPEPEVESKEHSVARKIQPLLNS